MKALSLIQPWADAVVFLGKDIENRVWSTSFRGLFLIHASASVGTRAAFHGAVEALRSLLAPAAWETYRRDRLMLDHDTWRPRETMQRGGIIGQATLVDVIVPCKPAPRSGGLASAFAVTCKHHWHAPAQYGFLLSRVAPLTFQPFKGALGFVDVPDDVARNAGAPSCAHSVPACKECIAHDTMLAMSS